MCVLNVQGLHVAFDKYVALLCFKKMINKTLLLL